MDDFGDIKPFKAGVCTNIHISAMPSRFLCVGCAVDMPDYSERKLVRERVNRLHKLFPGRLREDESDANESDANE
jgi:hypothetical protein